MREFFIFRFREFCKDRLQWGCSVFSFIIFAFHHYQFIDSGHMVEPLIRMVFYFFNPFVVFFLGRKSIKYLFLVFALTVELFAQFHNYTAFIICLMFIYLKPKSKYFIYALYVIDAVVTCTLHDKSAIHLTVHFLNCAFLCFVFQFIVDYATRKIKSQNERLLLDQNEMRILKALSEGAKQKEIDGYSENTVSKKLKLMREKNRCRTNEELLMRFISENP